jgi:hypothetical protein
LVSNIKRNKKYFISKASYIKCKNNIFEDKMEKLEQNLLGYLANEGPNNLIDFEATFKNIESNLTEVKQILNSSTDERVQLINKEIDKLK